MSTLPTISKRTWYDIWLSLARIKCWIQPLSRQIYIWVLQNSSGLHYKHNTWTIIAIINTTVKRQIWINIARYLIWLNNITRTNRTLKNKIWINTSYNTTPTVIKQSSKNKMPNRTSGSKTQTHIWVLHNTSRYHYKHDIWAIVKNKHNIEERLAKILH